MIYNVYLICAEIGNEKLYKIGYTKRDIEKRIKELKTGNAADFYLVNSFESKWGTKIESILHRSLRSKKVSGEWFLLDENDISSFSRIGQSKGPQAEFGPSSRLISEFGGLHIWKR